MNSPANPNKALWEKGDFTRIAATMRESGEALVQTLGITKGMKVLDLECGGDAAEERLRLLVCRKERARLLDGKAEGRRRRAKPSSTVC